MEGAFFSLSLRERVGVRERPTQLYLV